MLKKEKHTVRRDVKPSYDTAENSDDCKKIMQHRHPQGYVVNPQLRTVSIMHQRRRLKGKSRTLKQRPLVLVANKAGHGSISFTRFQWFQLSEVYASTAAYPPM